MSHDNTRQQTNTLLIIGFGMATARLLNKLAELGCSRPIVVVSREKQMGYNRIQLTPWLSGDKDDTELALIDDNVWANLNLTTYPQTDVVSLNSSNSTADLSNGQIINFGQAVIATGAKPRMPNCAYTKQPAIRAFRTFEDGYFLRDLPENSQVAVLGGGLLGLEAAWGLGKLGHQVTLIHRNTHLLNRQISQPLAALLETTFKDAGITFHLNCQIQTVDSSPALTSITLNTGTTLPVDCLVAAAGIEPNISLAEKSGIKTQHGVLVDEHLQTSEGNIFAIGECSQFQDHTFGLVAPAYEQANVLAKKLMGEVSQFKLTELDTRLKISGLDVFSVGNINHKNARILNMVDRKNKRGRALHLLNDQIIGAELIGDISLANFYNDVIRTQRPVKNAKEALMGRLENAA